MISLILPFHSDIERLKQTLKTLKEKQSQYNITEILLCHNGMGLEPTKSEELKSYLFTGVKLLHVDAQGIGAGYKLGIQNATEPVCVLSASDLPFGFTDIESYDKLKQKPLFAIGSKAHKNSKIKNYGVMRTIASYAFWLLRALFLGWRTPKDSQGSILINTSLAKKLITKSSYDNYFFTVELITLAQREGIWAVEVPVILENHSGESSVSILRDSWILARNVIVFSKKIRNKK